MFYLKKLAVRGHFEGSKVQFIIMALKVIGLNIEMKHIEKLPSRGSMTMVLLTMMI